MFSSGLTLVWHSCTLVGLHPTHHSPSDWSVSALCVAPVEAKVSRPKENDCNSSYFYSCSPSFFPSCLSNFSLFFLLFPALTIRFLLNEIKTERERDRTRVRGDGIQVVLSQERETTWRDCVFECVLLTCVLLVFDSSMERRMCQFIFVFQCWGKTDEKHRKSTKQIFEEFDRGNIKNTRMILGVRSWVELWNDIKTWLCVWVLVLVHFAPYKQVCIKCR